MTKKPFNNPFAALKDQLKVEPKGGKVASAKPPPRVQQRALPLPEPLDDAALFRQAVGEVEKVRAGPKVVAPDPTQSLEEKRRILHEEEETMARLAELVAGEGPFELVDSDGFIEGAVEGLPPGLRKRLRQGEYAVQAQVDLHGLTRAEAQDALERFVQASRQQGLRCVLVIHGRGLHSEGAIPVLKQGVLQWLSRGRVGKWVLAFVSARPQDGGAGAVYVLLRQR